MKNIFGEWGHTRFYCQPWMGEGGQKFDPSLNPFIDSEKFKANHGLRKQYIHRRDLEEEFFHLDDCSKLAEVVLVNFDVLIIYDDAEQKKEEIIGRTEIQRKTTHPNRRERQRCRFPEK